MADEKNIPLYVDPQILARDLSNSLSVASRSATSPDDESQLRAASRRLGIPLETARTDPAATKQAVAQESFDATDYAKRFPTAAAYLANPDNALVARDDVEPLSAVEQAIRGQIDQNINGDLGVGPAQAATDRLLPDYAAERREREQVLRTEGFAAASALSRRQQQRRELLRATGSIGEIRQPEATPGNILSGLATDATTGFNSAKLGLAQQIGDLFGDNEERTEQYNRQRGQLDFERQLATPEFDTNVARWTYGGFSSLAQTAPAVGLSVATGSPALGLSMMGLQTYGEAYGRYRGRDASRGMASLGAAGEASVEVLTEILPMRFAVDRLGKAGLTQFFAGFLGRDMAGEQIATLAQDAIDTAIANPTKTWNDYLAERPEAAIQTAFATLVQSGTLAAIGEGVGRLAGTIDREQYAADTANRNAQQLADLMTAAAASMTRQRDPQTFAQLVQGAAEDSGSSPTEIFIDARILAPLLESAGMTPEQLAQSLPSVQEQLEEALATDGAVAIPIGEATAAFAGSGLEQEVVRNARVSEDAWTAAEAEEGAQLLAQLEQDAQKVLAEQTEAQAWEDSSNAVFDTLMGELSSAGRFTPDVNRAYATLVRNFYSVQASKLGVTPQELYAQFPLTVTSRAPGQQQSQVLDQYASSVTPEAKPGALTVQGVHFSTARRPVLDGRFFGTGLKGAERARLAGLPEDSPLRSRVLAYVDEGAGVRPEQGVGSVEHGVTMSNIYDTGKDPLGLWTGADANAREQAVLDAGFDGYYVPGVMAVGGGKTSGVVALLGEAAYNVPTTERAAPAEAAAQAQSPLQAALDALDASNRLPAGQIAPSRLGELTERLEPELYATLAPTGMFEGNEPRYRADIIADARNSEVFNQALSTRVPSAVRATEDALANVLAIDFASVLADEKTLAKNAATLRAMPNMRPTKARKPAKVVEQFVEHVVDNLLFLHDLMPAEQRDRAKLWYDGGRKMAEAWANRYGISEMQAAAAIAVLSPQNDWFQNVSAAERTADILFGMRDFQWDDAMSVEADRILGDKTDPKMELARGKKLSELLDRPDLAARWVRVFDQTHNSRAFNVLTPEGGAAGLRTTASGNPATMAWKTYDNIAAAISIYLDGRAENVFHQLGREHKVRNFYNNIFDPKSEMGFATIDTHAVAAGLLRPLAGADLEVAQNFGGAGSASSSITGLSGTYPIYLEAYRRAAEARGLLPREMQSITWEAVRGLFEGPRKNAMKAPANAIWERYKAGEIDQAQAQAEIVKLAGHITPPTWTEAEFNDTPGRTYEGDAQRAIDERGDAGAGEAAEARVMFEVAPDPNDAALTEQWNALSDAERLEISQQVAAQVVPKVLTELSTTGDFVMQLGGYLGATNPSMTLRLDRPELAVQAAKLLGHALAQDSMMVVTETQAIGTEPVGAVTISLPEGYGANEVAALYDRLFELQENGEPLVGGHTTANGQMTILNYSPLSSEDLAGRINEHLGDEFQIHVDQVYSAFPQKSEYGYASDQQDGATAPGKSSAQRRPDRLRSEATQLVREALAARAEPAVLNQGGLTDGTGNRTGRYSSGSLAPLEGAPTVEGATGPDPRLVAVAEQYARDNGIPLRRQAEFVEVDPERAARIAAAYEAMPHAPQDPAVKEAFENLIQQTMAQYRALEAAGYQFFLIDETNDPYAGNPWNAMRDLRANQRMGVFATEAGFGSGATELNVDDNPLLADTGLTWPYGSPDGQPKRVLANDLFRAVHDAFGHGLEGAGFRARGEENAWQAHVRLFTGSAVGAITTETRGQNSWLNYGPYGEQNRTAKVEDTVFADQKTGLMPEWTWTEGRVADEAQQGDVFNQPGQARATFNPATLEISLLEKADLSSFLHETGHFFFEMQATLAAQPNAPAEIVADMQTLLDHVGYTGTAAEWLAQPLNARREAHETIAETFEQYLFEGKAPSAELQSVFRRFRSWLISVYRSLQQMLATNERASLNPEVAAVFDRMIATDEAIAAAQAVRQFEPLFRSAEDAGMEPEAWAEYQATLQEQQAEAIEELQARTLRDLKWLDNARGRKLKELQKAAQAQRKAVRDEVTAEVNEQPIYKAMEFLKFGSLTDEDGSQIQIAVTKAAKLNITELERMYPEGELGTSVEWRKLGYGKYGMLSDAGLHPDTVAEMFGFRSGRQLVTELLNAEPKASVIDGMTDQRMLERHGDISSPEAMAEAANEALANDARSRLVATELKAVTKATGSPAALTRAARQAAEQIVAAKPVRNLRPDLAAASAARARKAAEKAMASGDTAAAAQAKRTEILQVQLERAQRRTQQEHDKALAGFKKIFKGTNEKLAKSRDVAMVTAARAVLARYGLAPNTSAANAQAYQQLLEKYDGAMAADIKSILQGLPPSVDFRDLTVEQFRGMRDVVNGLYYLSRRTRQMEIDGQKVDIDAIADELVTVVTERSGGTIPPLPGYTGTPTGLDKWKASLLSAKASLTRVEAWADNWGPAFKRYIWQPVSEATTVMRGKRNALVAQYRDLLKSIEKGITYNKIDAPELGPAGFVFNAGKSELLHAVLHSGNQSNLTKLLLGRGWGTLDANGQLDTRKWDQFITRMINEGVLTKADFDFAQGVWDLLETVKKDAQAAHKEMYGYYFNEVTADPINTPFGTYRGGYVPALADSLSSPDMAQKREQEELLHAGNSFMFPTTGKGFTQSRVFYNKPLELDLRAIGQHLDKVSRFAYLEPAIRDVAQLMGNKRVARALNGASPGAISDMLTPWLQRTARQTASMPGKNPKMNRFFNGLRSRTGLLFMFGNIVNTLQQLTGFSLATLKVPAPKLLRATASYLAHPLKMRQQVGERSPWLAERMANQSYAMQDQIDQILTNPNPYEKFTDFVRRHAYFLQQAMQNVMDPIIWTGAYDHATAQGATEKEARRYADETVRTTQGSFAPEDIAAFEVQSPFVRLFTQFYGYFNMWGNLIGNEANKAVREAGFVRASPRLMFIWFAGLAIPAFVAELIAQGTPDDEDDEDGDGLLDEWLAMFFGSQAKSLATMIPIAGHGAVLVANQSDSRVWNDRLNVGPALSAGESAGKGLAAIITGEVFDEEFTKTEYRSLLTLLGLGTGLPVAPVARAGGYLFDVESGRKDPQSAAEMGIGIATGR